MKLAVLLILVLTITLSAAAQKTQSDPNDITKFNGYSWQYLNDDQRLTYVSGYFNGWWWGSVLANSNKPPAVYLTVGQIIVGIDQCYSDKRNLPVPINACFVVTVGRSKGEPYDKLEEFLAMMRKEAK